MPHTMVKTPNAAHAPSSGSRSSQQRRLSARLCAGERVDDLAEQHRLGELRDRQREIGDGQEPAEPPLLPEQPQHPDIQANEFHDTPSEPCRTLSRHFAFSP